MTALSDNAFNDIQAKRKIQHKTGKANYEDIKTDGKNTQKLQPCSSTESQMALRKKRLAAELELARALIAAENASA